MVSDPFRDALQAALAPSYQLDRELTGGGMSRVFVATERALGRTVVVKVLSPELSVGVNRERFRREIQLAAQLQHPHIVPLLSAGEHGELLYYTMPYIEGESLRARLGAAGRLPVRDVVRILHDVVDALAYAHRRGVVHRDIKPGNILMHGAHALVTDFGVAKALSAALPHSGTTSVGVAMGTPQYMAPEQLAADPAADHRVDIYAVGLVAYELLTGGSPFTSPSPRETMAAQLTRMPEPLHECCPDVPPELSAVIMRCLEKSPEARYDSAAVLLAALDEATATSAGSLSRAAAWGPAAGGAGPGLAPTSGPTSGELADGGRAATPADGGPPSGGPASSGPATPAGAVAARSARRWLVGGALVTLGVVAGAALAARWQAGRDDANAGVAGAVLATAGDTTRGASVVPVVPPVGQAASGGPAAAAGPAQSLTRDDSLAIAAAVRDRLEAAQPAPRLDANARILDSITSVLQRILADSVARALREAERAGVRGREETRRWVMSAEEAARLRELGRVRVFETRPGVGTGDAAAAAAGAGGAAQGSGTVGAAPVQRVEVYANPRIGGAATSVRGARSSRRVIIADVRNATGRRELGGAAAAVGRALRERLEAGRTYDVGRQPPQVDPTGRAATAYAAATGAGAVLIPMLLPRGDSLIVQVIVTDVQRGYPVATIEVATPAETPLAGVDKLAAQLRAVLNGLPWSPPATVKPGSVPPAPAAPPPPPVPPATEVRPPR